MENLPFIKSAYSFSWVLTGIALVTVFMSDLRSPRPRSLLMKDSGSNISRSSNDSPVPKKIIGEPVAATAERAPPPLACPSSLVMMTEPTSTASLKAYAYSVNACPIDPSITKTVSAGSVTSLICRISSNKLYSCMCLPDVSTMMISYFSFLKNSTPSSAIFTGSVSSGLP
jgi:hypothetical protein